MRTKLLLICKLIIAVYIQAQVGINTSDPKATLDINGNIKIRTLPTVGSIGANQSILVHDRSASGDFEVKEISADNLLGSYASNAYYASKTGGWALVDLGLGNSWSKVNLTGTADTKLGNAANFTAGVYTAPQAGVYLVSYEFHFNAGVNLEVLGGKRLGILKNNVVYDDKIFEGVRIALVVPVASAPITSTELSSLVQLAANDKLTFAVNVSGLVAADLALLTNARVNIKIHRLPN